MHQRCLPAKHPVRAIFGPLGLCIVLCACLGLAAGCASQGKASPGSPDQAKPGVPSASPADQAPIAGTTPVRPEPASQKHPSLQDLQRAFVDLRFGMFIHFGILTYTGQWSQARLDIKKFNPAELDCGQWADTAKAAGMTFGVLTTRHHDGFALWPTSTTDFSVKSIPWRDGKGDVVREYVDAFRSRGLGPGLYYSVWDNTQGVGNRRVGKKDLDYVKTQLRELLTNYGPIPVLVLDGYSWSMGHRAIQWSELREFVRSLQPECLVIDHTHIQSPWESDLAVFEEPRGVFAPEGNTVAAAQGNKIIEGNDWFWGSNSATSQPLSAENIVQGHLVPLEQRYTTFILNCPPDRRGLMDDRIVEVLKEVGETWKPDTARPPLPPQGPQIEHYVPVKAAKATSGDAGAAIDGKNDSYYYSVWETSEALPQSVTLDLGEAIPDIAYLSYVPRYTKVETPGTSGAITRWKISGSLDGKIFQDLAQGTWKVDTLLKTVEFTPTTLRYLKIEVLEANNGYAAATEFGVGRK